MTIVARFAVKPTSSILTPRRTVTRAGQATEIVASVVPHFLTPCWFTLDPASPMWLRPCSEIGVEMPDGAGIEITPLQTEHRARTPEGGTLAGSTRKMERQSGQLTFIRPLQSCEHRESRATVPAE